jgi:hypothetical protein
MRGSRVPRLGRLSCTRQTRSSNAWMLLRSISVTKLTNDRTGETGLSSRSGISRFRMVGRR